MRKVGIVMMALAVGSLFAQPAFSRMRDNASYGFCPDGTKVPDTSKCPKAEKPKTEKQKK